MHARQLGFGFGLLLFAMGSTPQVPATAATEQTRQELVFLSWGDYIDQRLVTAFEKANDVRVRMVYFDSDTQRDEMMLAAEGTGYDLVLASGASLGVWAREGWLDPLSETKVPNLVHIDPRWRHAFPGAEEFGVPYFWGTVGIGYRRDLVQEPITSWMQLFRPPAEVRGKIAMIRDASDLVGMALKALGYSANTTDSEQLALAEALLQEQKPFVKAYQYDAVNENSGLVTGELVAAMLYNGDGRLIQKHNPAVTFVLPEEGGNLWVDYLVVLKSSRNSELAWRFINFFNEPRNAAQLAETLYYATPNRAAEGYLPEAYFSDPVIYPSGAALERSERYEDLPPRSVKQRNAIVDRLLN